MSIPGRVVNIPLLLAIALASVWGETTQKPSELTMAIQAYQEDRLMTALGHFIHVLEKDPANDGAHAYMHLIIHKLEERQARKNREEGIEILKNTSRLLQDRHEDSQIEEAALQRTLAQEAQRRNAEAHSKCSEAQMEAQLGRLCVASDLVLQVTTQDERNEEAMRLWTDVQSQIQQMLGSKTDLPLAERHALEGFYAYGQADWASAAAAWGQARSALDQSSSTEAAHQAALLHFEPYEKIAQGHLEQERLKQQAQALFNEGRAAYDRNEFEKSSGNFRQVALINPDYPQLGFYLVKAEAAVEKNRTKDLTDEKRQQAEDAFAKGVASLAKGDYAEAQDSFELVLSLDPKHPLAPQYLKQIDTQKNRQVDPAAAKEHYEAGVIAYARGDSEQAARELHIAQRLDPDNPQIAEQFRKIEKELALSKELP